MASLVVDSALEDGQTLVESVASLMDRNKKIEMQLAAARVVCYLNRYVNILKSFVKLIQNFTTLLPNFNFFFSDVMC